MGGNQLITNVSGILIAGGKSRRMGRDKRFLKMSGNSIFDRTLHILRETFAETIVVLAEPVDSLNVHGCRVVYDLVSNAGSLGGLYTGLMASSQARIFAVACDMPFLNPDVIRLMVSFDVKADVVVAKLERRFQPMHALYSRRCAPFCRAMVDRHDLKIQKLFSIDVLQVAIVTSRELTIIDPSLRSFQNINTPEDLALAEAPVSETL
ncbi:MAG: putative Molybdopterin-guanine dinucleotide biosynthesis protein [Nitrospira sp.]|jgi:molybdopterin-guanine dinucleotide biosynthesis protein A|nr:putative Molybdopterin-guanine dinucleotide biosynthesis protein [Nitrospira sp.]MDF2458685.1 putative Molybdopterin-guanine dinucleotide biosynthesis protein [Nitrospira sp.]